MTEQRQRTYPRVSRLIGLGSLIGLLVLTTTCDVGGGTPVPGLLTPTIEVTPQESPYLFDVAMASPAEGWAVGVLTKGVNGILQPHSDGVLVHYTGEHWNAVQRVPKVALNGVSMVAVDDGWAVGSLAKDDGTTTTVTMHYTGAGWQEVPSGLPGALAAVHMISATDGWAVGSNPTGTFTSDAILLHYTGGKWEPVPSPVADDLSSVAMVSATDGWIVGGAYKGQNHNSAIILHYTGGKWEQVTSPTLTPLLDVSMSSSSDGWAVGTQYNARYHEGTWERTERPGGNPPRQVFAVSADEAWAVGTSEYGQSSSVQHYTNGAWELVDPQPAGLGLNAISMTSPSEGWAMGRGGSYAHFRDGDWLEYSP